MVPSSQYSVCNAAYLLTDSTSHIVRIYPQMAILQVLCIFHVHISDWIRARTCLDVFEKVIFQVKSQTTIVGLRSPWSRWKSAEQSGLIRTEALKRQELK